MKKTSLILKHFLIVIASVVGALTVMLLLALVTVNLRKVPNLMEHVREAIDSLNYYYDTRPIPVWIVAGLLTFLVLFALLSLPIILRVRRVSSAVGKIAEGGYDVRLEPRGRDELSQLERDVNAMAQRINKAFAAQQAAEKSKDEFVMNIAHDLRTPLTSVLGYLALMQGKDLSAEEMRSNAGIALSKANLLAALVNGLFELMRMTPDAMRPDRSCFSARRFLLQVQDEAFPMLHEAGMEIRLVDVPGDIMLNADGALLSRVYDNLILNAIRYAREGKHIDFTAFTEDGQTVLAVVTHANPVPESELESIFERLYRVEASRSLETGGAGLGLAICKRVLALHGGTIVASRTMDGTRFEMRFPMDAREGS